MLAVLAVAETVIRVILLTMDMVARTDQMAQQEKETGQAKAVKGKAQQRENLANQMVRYILAVAVVVVSIVRVFAQAVQVAVETDGRRKVASLEALVRTTSAAAVAVVIKQKIVTAALESL